MAEDGRLRRAELADIPAICRLLQPSQAAALRGVPLSREVSAGALRLVLTHVGLDRGELWVAGDGRSVRGAIALLPPRGNDNDHLLLALRLELGLGTGLGPAGLTETAMVPPLHWLLLAHDDQDLPALLARVLPVIDESGLATVCVMAADPPEALLANGFRTAAAGFVLRDPVAYSVVPKSGASWPASASASTTLAVMAVS